MAVLPGMGCGEAGQKNVLLIVVDALRGDRLGSYGYVRDTSPYLDAFAAESIVFEGSHAQSPWTKPSVPTLFTSLYPIQHGVYEGEAHGGGGGLESDVLADRHVTLAEAFRTAGFATVAFVHNAHLEAAHGFAQGFERYAHGRADAREINRAFLDFLDEERQRPFFAYLHYLDAHWPFQPESPFDRRFGEQGPPTLFDRESWKGLRDRINDGTLALSNEDQRRLQDLHDGGIAEIDQQLGALFDALRERGLMDETIVLLTSDHGEELLEHGRVGHGGTLYREVIEIPMILRLPHAARAGRSQRPARLLDVFPTLAALAGVEVPDAAEGRNLLGAGGPEPEIVAETRHKRTYRVSFRDGSWKYVRTYRARSSGSKRSPTQPPQLAPGMRVKAKGLFLEDGTLHAEKLSLKDAGDDDVELSGVVSSVSAETESFEIHGRRIAAGELLDERGAPLVDALAEGAWLKVEGKLDSAGALEADDFDWLREGDREDEIEAIVESIESVSDEGFIANAGGFRIVVAEDTRLEGFAGADIRSAATSPVPREDLFAVSRLLSADAPDFEEALFDLERDPIEQVDRIAEAGAPSEVLRAGLDAWLLRMESSAAEAVERRSLDSETIEELRVLGYVE